MQVPVYFFFVSRLGSFVQLLPRCLRRRVLRGAESAPRVSRVGDQISLALGGEGGAGIYPYKRRSADRKI